MAFCINCGTKLPEGAKFCPNCGTPAATAPTPLSAAPSPAPTQAATPVAAAAPVSAQAAPSAASPVPAPQPVSPQAASEAEEWRLKGVEFFEQKDYAKALEAYDQAIALDPEFARAWMNKGNLYWKMGEYYKAVAAYNRAIEICPAAGQLPDEGIYYFRRAISYGAMRNYPQTIADLEKALELGFDQSDCYYNLGLVYENMKDTEKAAAACRKAVELGNEDAQSKLDKMLVKAEAEAAANAAITYTPAEDFEYENTADGEGICIKGFKNTRAKTVAVPPEIDGKPVTEIGAQAFKPCKSLRSVTLTVTVVEIGTSAFENCKALAEIALPPRLARIKYIAFAGCKVLAAISLPRSLKSIGSRAFEDCAALEKISLPASLQELGSEVFSGCTALQTIWVLGNPGVFTYGASVGCNADIVYSENAEKYPYTWLEKASAYRNQGEYLDALEALDRAIAMEPANWRHYVARGKIWKEMKVYAKALADFRKAIELHPDNAGSNAEENTALISLNNEVETCTKHEAEVPDPVALWEEGTMHYQRAEKGGYEGEFREALKDFNRTIALKPDFVQAWTSKGALYKDMGELDKAIAAYSRAIELVPAAGQLPREGSYYFFRSAVWYELEDCGKALADILQALQLNPEEGAYYNNMGFICEQLEDKAKAIVAFQKAVEFGYEKAREQLDRLEADSGDDEDDGDSDDNEYTPAEDFNYGVPEDRDGVQIYGPKDRNIRSVNIPLDIDGMAVLEIGDGAFKDCASLVKITIPASVDYIGQEAFQSCTSLSVVNMGECLRYLGSRAFKNCSSLTEIDIPSTIEDIRGNVFDGCISLRTIRIHGGLDSVNVDEDTLSGCVTVHQDNHEKDYNLGMQQ